MILLIECVVCCLLFTIMVWRGLSKDLLNMIKSYPPAIVKRVEELPQYKDTIKVREKAHLRKKLVAIVVFVLLLSAIAYFSGCRSFVDTYRHVFILFLVVNLYDLVVLDWGHFCHSKKVRIPGTEDMVKEYQNPWFHLRVACIGTVLGLIVALLSGGLVHIVLKLI